MPWSPAANWQPTRLLEVAGSVDTSTGATEVNTDAGRAYIKAMGNRQGPHVPATDWVGTHLAKWFGLSTFDSAILPLTAEDTFPLPRGHASTPGPAWAEPIHRRAGYVADTFEKRINTIVPWFGTQGA